MKNLILTYLMLIGSLCCMGQKHLCQRGTMLYSVCYDLDTTGHFKYTYGHCTGRIVGDGYYTEKDNVLSFYFDNPDSAFHPGYECIKAQSKSLQAVQISIYDSKDTLPVAYPSLEYNGDYIVIKDSSNINIAYTVGNIGINDPYGDLEQIVINPSVDKCTNYHVYITRVFGETYVDSGVIHKMERWHEGYRDRKKVKWQNARMRENDKFKWRRQTTYYIEKKD